MSYLVCAGVMCATADCRTYNTFTLLGDLILTAIDRSCACRLCHGGTIECIARWTLRNLEWLPLLARASRETSSGSEQLAGFVESDQKTQPIEHRNCCSIGFMKVLNK